MFAEWPYDFTLTHCLIPHIIENKGVKTWLLYIEIISLPGVLFGIVIITLIHKYLPFAASQKKVTEADSRMLYKYLLIV